MGDTIVLNRSAARHEFVKADSGAMRFCVKTNMNSVPTFAFSQMNQLAGVDHPKIYITIKLGENTILHNKITDTCHKFERATFNDNFQEFIVTWFNDVILMFIAGEKTPFLKYHCDDQMKAELRIEYIIFFISERPPHNVEWTIENSPVHLKPINYKKIDGGELHWVKMNHTDELPTDAMIGGFENEPVYIARAYHNNSHCPGKYVRSKKKAYVPWGGREHQKEKFEILCGYNAQWVKTKSNFIPENAFIAGVSEVRQEPLYIGRAMYKHCLIPGKVHVKYQTCYLPYKGREIEECSYDILVLPNIKTRGILHQCQMCDFLW